MCYHWGFFVFCGWCYIMFSPFQYIFQKTLSCSLTFIIYFKKNLWQRLHAENYRMRSWNGSPMKNNWLYLNSLGKQLAWYWTWSIRLSCDKSWGYWCKLFLQNVILQYLGETIKHGTQQPKIYGVALWIRIFYQLWSTYEPSDKEDLSDYVVLFCDNISYLVMIWR